MGTVTGQELAKDIGQILIDSGFDAWTKADDIFPAITEAMRVIVMHRPDANPAPVQISLTPDSDRQSLPAGGLSLSKITKNRGIAGTDNGPSITNVARDVLDQTMPGWAQETTTTRIRHYIYSEEHPAIFFVYPIPTAALIVDAIIGKAPTPINEDADIIDVEDTYCPAIKEYALFRLKSMETSGISMEAALVHLRNFYNLMQIKAANQITAMQLKGQI